MLYLGPEIMMPLLSALAAVGGVLLMFWRRVKAGAMSIVRFVTRRPAAKPDRLEAEPVRPPVDVTH